MDPYARAARVTDGTTYLAKMPEYAAHPGTGVVVTATFLSAEYVNSKTLNSTQDAAVCNYAEIGLSCPPDGNASGPPLSA